MAARRLSDYLRRFRPTAAPGAAAPAGVPSDLIAEVEAELAPVFAALEDARDEAQAIAEDAAAAAREIDRVTSERLESIETRGRREAARARLDASSGRARLARDEQREVQAAAEEESAAIDARAAERLPELVERVVDAVLESGCPDPPPDEGAALERQG